MKAQTTAPRQVSLDTRLKKKTPLLRALAEFGLAGKQLSGCRERRRVQPCAAGSLGRRSHQAISPTRSPHSPLDIITIIIITSFRPSSRARTAAPSFLPCHPQSTLHLTHKGAHLPAACPAACLARPLLVP
ncbi:hypothetical protein L1887_54789 [Cichorium endivia]|nr:hypothetical protein L1887_54789 [Cichorium endivia]